MTTPLLEYTLKQHERLFSGRHEKRFFVTIWPTGVRGGPLRLFRANHRRDDAVERRAFFLRKLIDHRNSRDTDHSCRCLGIELSSASAMKGIQAIEEISYRFSEKGSNLEEHRAGNTIGRAFIFLNLLKSQAQYLG